ncbi:MAG: cytochrome c biogenesis protein CcdA [Propionibacteriaceae bacterium]|jgi:cytochrome c-type biogenesis protein|nr:cytochrome c biogenesis protein CcdA [Propionibacteriaceae bacterium]
MELTLPLVLLAGVVSFASPCFLPVVPVFASYLGGQTAAVPSSSGPTPPRARALRGALHASVFTAAFTTVFVALWAAVAFIGWAVGDYRPWLRIAGGAILVVLGLQLTGLLRIGLLDRMLRPAYTPDGSAPPTLRRSVLLGLAFGAGWTPCIGPVLGGVLGLATNASSVGGGVGLLLVYSLGFGLPFVLVCAGISSVAARLSWFARHQRQVNCVAGALLILVGFLMIADLLSRLSSLFAVAL